MSNYTVHIIRTQNTESGEPELNNIGQLENFMWMNLNPISFLKNKNINIPIQMGSR